MGLFLLTPPIAEPISLQEAKDFCRVTHDAEDTLFTSLITAATRHLERDLNISLSEQQWKLTLNWFSDRIALPRGPVITVDAIEYLDEDGALQTADADLYTADLETERQYLARELSIPAPRTKLASNAVAVTYTAGMDDIETGKDLWLALQFLIQHFYTRGQSEEPPPLVRTLSQPYQRYL